MLSLPGQQVPAGPEHEQRGEGVKTEIEDVAEAEEDRRRQERRAERVPEFEEFSEPAGGVEHPEGEPSDAEEPVEPRGQPPGRSDPGVVDPEEAVDLEGSVPDPPEEHDQGHAVQAVRGEAERGRREDERGHDKAGPEAPEEGPVAVRPHHPGEVVAEGAEPRDQEPHGVGRLPALERESQGEDQDRGGDQQEQVPDRPEHPEPAACAGRRVARQSGVPSVRESTKRGRG